MNILGTIGENPMRKQFQSVLIISTCFLGLTLSLQAETNPPPSSTPPATLAEPPAPTNARGGAAPLSRAGAVTNNPADAAGESIVIDFNEADMQRVLRTLAT